LLLCIAGARLAGVVSIQIVEMFCCVFGIRFVAKEIKSAIEYYCTSKLKAGIGQIQIPDLEKLEAVIPDNVEGFAKKVAYHFKYFEGEDKKLIYLPDAVLR